MGDQNPPGGSIGWAMPLEAQSLALSDSLASIKRY
jgi:hypothetical protein